MRQRGEVPRMAENEMVYKNIRDTLLGSLVFMTTAYLTGGAEDAKIMGFLGAATGFAYRIGGYIGKRVKEIFPTDNGNNDNIVSSSATIIGITAVQVFSNAPVSIATVAGVGFAGGYVMETVVRPYMEAAFPQVRNVNHQGRVGVEPQRAR